MFPHWNVCVMAGGPKWLDHIPGEESWEIVLTQVWPVLHGGTLVTTHTAFWLVESRSCDTILSSHWLTTHMWPCQRSSLLSSHHCVTNAYSHDPTKPQNTSLLASIPWNELSQGNSVGSEENSQFLACFHNLSFSTKLYPFILKDQDVATVEKGFGNFLSQHQAVIHADNNIIANTDQKDLSHLL